MDDRTTGLILRLHPLTETSLIVHWLTPDLGRLATVAKAARRPTSPFRGKLDLFYLAQFSFRRSRRSDLHTLREVSLLDPSTHLRLDLLRFRQAAYAAALITQTSETETPLPVQFALLRDLLGHLRIAPPQPATIFAFELKLLHELGLAPSLPHAPLSPGSRQLLLQLAQGQWQTIPRLILSPAQTAEIGRFLHNFLADHTGHVPPGRPAALATQLPPSPASTI